MSNVGRCILLVGVRTEGDIPKIVNAFEGREAEDLYKKLMVRSVD